MSKSPMLSELSLLSHEGDFHTWKKNVGQWSDALKEAHDNGHYCTLQTMFKLLGRTLYKHGLLEAQKAIFHETQSKVCIN